MEFFVNPHSIVRQIWGKADTVLFIFAGASAEFALNKAVDWLYFTGKLPADPLGRLFITVKYAQEIVFNSTEIANKSIDQMTKIHNAVEKGRRMQIPDWAYRDVLYMLIHYSQASFELLERKMTADEKEELFDVFNRVGLRMGLKDLPNNFEKWVISRNQHLQQDLIKSNFTADLYKQYRKYLGMVRYKFLIEAQKLVVPEYAKQLLGLDKYSWLPPVLFGYKFSRVIKLDGFLKNIVLPKDYKAQIKALDIKD